MVTKKFLSLNDIRAYRISTGLSDYVWEIVSRWDIFNKQTLGSQIVRSIDSIAGNLAEGFGRYHKKDKEKFYCNSRGSLYESIHWTDKAKARSLIDSGQYAFIMEQLTVLPREINWLIKITEEKLTI